MFRRSLDRRLSQVFEKLYSVRLAQRLRYLNEYLNLFLDWDSYVDVVKSRINYVFEIWKYEKKILELSQNVRKMRYSCDTTNIANLVSKIFTTKKNIWYCIWKQLELTMYIRGSTIVCDVDSKKEKNWKSCQEVHR